MADPESRPVVNPRKFRTRHRSVLQLFSVGDLSRNLDSVVGSLQRWLARNVFRGPPLGP